MKSVTLYHIEKISFLPKDQYILVGSALLVQLGHLPKNQDLDVVTSTNNINKYFKNNNKYLKKKVDRDTVYYLPDDSVEVGDRFSCLNMDYDDLKKNSIKINGYNFMSPELLLKFYKKLNRPKDQLKIKILEKINVSTYS